VGPEDYLATVAQFFCLPTQPMVLNAECRHTQRTQSYLFSRPQRRPPSGNSGGYTNDISKPLQLAQ